MSAEAERRCDGGKRGHIVKVRPDPPCRLDRRDAKSPEQVSGTQANPEGEACDYDPPSDTGDRLATDFGSVEEGAYANGESVRT
jgi:hypothetical protein